MQQITILAVGRMKNKYFNGVCAEYLKRISPYAQVKMEEIKAEAFFGEDDKDRAKKREGERILKFLEGKNNYSIFLLEEEGSESNSVDFSQKIEKIQSPIVFVIAGALGFSAEVKSRGFLRISLSQMTFPHELARVILLEQLYRAAAISRGKKYHY